MPQVCQGRLTTESGVPVSASDRTAQATLYWTPCTPEGVSTTSGLVGFYDGTRYVVRSLPELSLSLATAEAGGAIDVNEMYDVFLDYNGGSPALVIGPSWTNDTTRATALAKQGSLIVLTGDTDWRWVGTIRASASGVTEDSLTKRFVANACNQVDRRLFKQDTTDSTYTTGTARYYANDANNKFEWILPAPSVMRVGLYGNIEGRILIGAQLDWTSGAAPNYQACYNAAGTGSNIISASAFSLNVGLGYHYLAITEEGYGTAELAADVGINGVVLL